MITALLVCAVLIVLLLLSILGHLIGVRENTKATADNLDALVNRLPGNVAELYRGRP